MKEEIAKLILELDNEVVKCRDNSHLPRADAVWLNIVATKLDKLSIKLRKIINDDKPVEETSKNYQGPHYAPHSEF